MSQKLIAQSSMFQVFISKIPLEIGRLHIKKYSFSAIILKKNMSSITKRHLLVDGKPTELLTLGLSLDENPKKIILIIPGNPGVASYYKTFMQTIYSQLEGTHAVWAVSHAGHCQTNIKLSGPGVYDLNDQIKHKVSFLREYIPADADVTLVGHSIGCKIILDCIKTFKPEDNGVRVTQSYLLFPTIERMKDTPQGVRLWPMLCYLRWLVVFFAACLNLLPSLLKHKLHNILYPNIPRCCVDATVELLHPNIVRNVLWMAYHELLEVNNPDLTTLEQFGENILIYYGAQDGWCPLSFREELIVKLPKINTQICSMNIAHAFVLHSSETMGNLLAKWMK